MSNYIKKTYGAPADVGRRVTVDGNPGTIADVCGKYIFVRLDGDNRETSWHETWRVEYGEMDPTRPEGGAQDE